MTFYTDIINNQMDDVLRKLALVDEVVRKSLAPTVNAHSEALSRMAQSMEELRSQGFVPANDLAPTLERFGAVILQHSKNIQQTKITELMSELSTALQGQIQRINHRLDELYLVCRAISIGNQGLNKVMSLEDEHARWMLLNLGDDLPLAVDIATWHMEDNGMLPNLDGTFKRYISCVKAGLAAWNAQNSTQLQGRTYQQLRQWNNMPGVPTELQDVISQMVQQFPIEHIAQQGGWRTTHGH